MFKPPALRAAGRSPSCLPLMFLPAGQPLGCRAPITTARGVLSDFY